MLRIGSQSVLQTHFESILTRDHFDAGNKYSVYAISDEGILTYKVRSNAANIRK